MKSFFIDINLVRSDVIEKISRDKWDKQDRNIIYSRYFSYLVYPLYPC